MSEDVVELQETQQEDRSNNHNASENKKENNIKIKTRYEMIDLIGYHSLSSIYFIFDVIIIQLDKYILFP